MVRVSQSARLTQVAGRVLAYRQEDLKIQTDRRAAGLNLEADLLAAQAALAKAQADVLAARLQYKMAVTDLHLLTGRFPDT